MEGKFSPLIIGILVLIVIAIAALCVNIFFFSKPEESVGEQIEISEKPIIELAKEIDENNKEKVYIKVSAATEDGSMIKQIILPDGTTIMGSSTTYEVTENGDYEFLVYSEKGISNKETINVSELEEISSMNPYVPEGFSVIGGYPDSGYVIEDEYGNQYVWVPVSNGKLVRTRMLDTEYEETSEAATALVNSVAKYYGFYIARFEASQYEIDGKVVAASMAGKTPWTNITCQDAIKTSVESAGAFGYEGYNTALISSYAWDTTLEWINTRVEDYSSKTNYGNYTETILPTGYTAEDNINNICDLAGNVREWTTEIYKYTTADKNNKNSKSSKDNKDIGTYIYRIVRGGCANLTRPPMAYTAYAEDTDGDYWGFRMVLYK